MGGGDGNRTSSNAESFVLDNSQVIDIRCIVQDRAGESFVCLGKCMGVVTPSRAREFAEDAEVLEALRIMFCECESNVSIGSKVTPKILGLCV